MKSRPYHQVARAASVERTRAGILDAVEKLFWEGEEVEFSLEDVASASGTTLQTILRHFGSKSDLVGAAAARGAGRVETERDEIPASDLAAVAAYLARHYEEQGDRMIRLLGLEQRSVEVARIVAQGRGVHRRFVQRTLLPLLPSLGKAELERTTASLVAVTDLLTWKVLRREQGLPASDYRRCVEEMLEALIAWRNAQSASRPRRDRAQR